jgi:hypothetical protein
MLLLLLLTLKVQQVSSAVEAVGSAGEQQYGAAATACNGQQ